MTIKLIFMYAIMFRRNPYKKKWNMYAKQVLIHHLSCITYEKEISFTFTVRFYALQFHTLFVCRVIVIRCCVFFFQFCIYKLRRQFNNNANYGKTDKVEALKLQLKCMCTQGFESFRACVRNVCALCECICF